MYSTAVEPTPGRAYMWLNAAEARADDIIREEEEDEAPPVPSPQSTVTLYSAPAGAPCSRAVSDAERRLLLLGAGSGGPPALLRPAPLPPRLTSSKPSVSSTASRATCTCRGACMMVAR